MIIPYESVHADIPLTQGDLIDDCPIFVPDPQDMPGNTREPDRFSARVIVLTQACDLANVKADRVVIAVVHDAEEQIRRGALKSAAIRDQVRHGKTFGWYFLPASNLIGLPESLVDLRDLHTVPRAVLDRLIAAGKRVGRLITPFREHLAQHFAVTYMRIALPEAYETQP